MKKHTAIQADPDPSTKKSVQISVVIPTHDHEKLKRQSQKELTSQGQLVRKLLHAHLESLDTGGRCEDVEKLITPSQAINENKKLE